MNSPLKLVFVAYGGGHIGALLPVARYARELGHEVVMFTLTTARTAAKRAGFDALGFADFPEGALPGADVHGRRLTEGFEDGPVPLQESIAYLGACYAELEEHLGAEQARTRYDELGRQCFLPVSFMTHVLEQLTPDAVIATSAPRAERAAIEAAGRLGIPSVCVADLFLSEEIRWVGKTGFADRVCVLSDSVQERLLDAGRTPNEIVVTGNPAFDRLAEPAAVVKGQAIREQLGWQDHFVIGWASQPEPLRLPNRDEQGDPNRPLRIEQALIDLGQADSTLALFVRHHPSEHRETPTESATLKISGQETAVVDLLHACDCLVTISSTVGLEAALLGKPVVCVASPLLGRGAPYADMGLALGVDSERDLGDALSSIRSRAWQPSSNLPRSGDATKAVIDEIEAAVERRLSSSGFGSTSLGVST